MSRNRSNFVRVMGTASAVVLSSTLAVPAVAIAADTDGAELVELSDAHAEKRANEVIAMIDALPEDPDFDDTDAYDQVVAAQEALDKFDTDYPAYSTLIDQDTRDALAKAYTEIVDAQDSKVAAVESLVSGLAPASSIEEIDDLVDNAYEAGYARMQYNALGKLQSRIDEATLGNLKDVESAINKVQIEADKNLKDANDLIDDQNLSGFDLDKIKARQDEKLYAKAWMAYSNTRNILFYLYGEADEVRSARLVIESQQIVVDTKQDDVDTLQKQIDKEKDPATKAHLEADMITAKKELADAQDALDDAKAYKDGFTEEQKRLDANIDLLEALEEALMSSPIDAAYNAIDALPNLEDLTLEDAEDVAKARELYDALTEEQKDEFDTKYPAALDDLVAYEEKIEKLAGKEDAQAAKKVSDAIAALPPIDELTYEDKDQVEAARAAYDALSENAKKLVSKDSVAALEAAEKKIEELKPVVASQVYRLYNPNSGEHFYTADEAEKDALTKIGWTNETSDTNAWFTTDEMGDAVYRLYNPNAEGGDHHYTMDSAEVDALVKAGWQKDNDGKPVFYSADSESGVAIYRAYNPNEEAHNHNYTPDKAEQDALVKAGWNDEKVAFYGAPMLKDAE